ncbi:MAG: putative aliphatic sulfonates transport permease protein SsuC [Syntrophorhabdaceae bacterium]|nr:putative aliphatic sulfonates transport permease protein SsuC [Syntrophorhabdaceae bacterium]
MKREMLYGPLVLFLLWYILYWIKLINPLFLPPPHTVMAELCRMSLDSDVWKDISSSLWRIIIGFLIAVMIGTPIGLFMGYYKKIYSAFEFIVDFFRSLPALAVFPLLMFFFGIGDAAKIATTIFSCSLIIVVNSIYGVTISKKTRQVVAFLMDANAREIFWKVVLMDALPQVFVGMRTSLSLAVVVVIVTEMFIGTTWGIGHRIFEAQLTYRVPEMYSSIIIAGLLGYGLNKCFVIIEKKIIHWSGK